MDGTKLNHPAPRTVPAGTDSVSLASNNPIIVDPPACAPSPVPTAVPVPQSVLVTPETAPALNYRNHYLLSTYQKKKTWRTPAAMGWLISLLLHIAMAGTFLVLSIFRETPKLQDQPNLQTPVQTALTNLEMSPVVSDLQMEPMLTDDFTPENPLLPQLPHALPTNPTTPEQAANLAVFSESNSGFTVPANSVSGGNPYRSQFCGTAGSGQCICYVVDCSGSMVMALDYVRAELRRAISQLTPAQYFHVIFYAGAEPIELPPGRLIRASAPNRQRAIEFVNQVKLKTVADKASAAPAVVKALQKALTTSATNHLQANLVYLLTDGQYDHSYVADAVKRIQTQRIRPARINVISCGMRQNETFLRRLALSYQGSYHYVSDEQMAEKK